MELGLLSIQIKGKKMKLLEQIEINYKMCVKLAKAKNRIHSNCVQYALSRVAWSNSHEELKANTKKCLDWINN